MAVNRRHQEKRAKNRVGISVTMPIHIVRMDSGDSLQCLLTDVSPTGIGVTLEGEVSPGDQMQFKTLRKTWVLEVSWCEKTSGGWKCGLVLQDKSQDLAAIFSSFAYKPA